MKSQNLPGRWLIAPALFLAFCSTGNSPSLTSPSSRPPGSTAAALDGRVGASAAGDIKVGSGALEMVRLRMDRQTASGTSVVRQYANPGGAYAMNAGETIELWAEWNSNEVSGTPRFRVEWGDGGVDIIHCGPCLLKHAYPGAGLYSVKATLDDRVSTTVTRLFTLDSRQPVPAPSPSPGLNTGDTVRLVNGSTIQVQYLVCGSGNPGTCTASAARSTCQNAGLKVVSHASNGSATVASLGGSQSCHWSISYFSVGVQMPAGACLVGVSNLDWSSCCDLDQWHGNTLAFGAPNTIFGYVHTGESGYDAMNANLSGTTWGCQGLTEPATNLSGCTQQYVACTH